MKKVIISLVLAIVAGLVTTIKYCVTPSDIVNCFTVDENGMLYIISQYDDGIYMLRSGEGVQDKAVDMNELLGNGRQYLDIISVHDELYVLSQGMDEAYDLYVYVDRFDKDGGWKGCMSSIPLDNYSHVFDASFSEFYNYELENIDKVYVTVCTGNKIFAQEIGRNGRTGELERYVVDGMTPYWANRFQEGVVFRDNRSRYYIIDNDRDLISIGSPGIYLERPFTNFGMMIYGVDLSDISMGCLIMSFGEDGSTIGLQSAVGLGSISADREVADGITFSDLRNFKASSVIASNSFFFMGLSKPDGERGQIVTFNDYDSNSKVYDEPLLPPLRGIIFGLVVAGAVFAAALLVLFIIGRLLALRKVVVKQVLISVVLLACAFGVMYSSFYRFISNFIDNAQSVSLSDTLAYISKSVDAEGLSDGLSDEELALLDEYQGRISPLVYMDRSMLFPDLFATNATIQFVRVAKADEDGFRYVYNLGLLEPAANAKYYTSQETLDKIAALPEGDFVVTRSKSDNRPWFEESCGIYDDDGNMTGFVMVGYQYDTVESSVRKTALLLSVIWCMIFAVICAVFLLFLVKLLSPLKKLKKAVSEISEGKIGTQVVVKTNDELQDIAYSFSEMSVKLKDYFNSINVISKAYERYLPKDFFRLMDKRSVLEVSPEDNRTLMLTYLFIGIDMSRVHTRGADGFALLNRIYGQVSMAVTAFGGAVQSLDDRRITCIFSGDTSGAAEAALTIREKLTAEELSDADVKITLQRAESTIGVIGTGEAMKPVTVSSAIEIQQYIAAVMKEYDLSYVMTGRVRDSLTGMNITARYIGSLSELCGVSDRRFEDISLYDCPEGCSDEMKQRRLATMAAFSRGMDAYAAGDLREARSRMIEVLRTDRGDLIARHYLMLCEGGGFLKENKDELRSN